MNRDEYARLIKDTCATINAFMQSLAPDGQLWSKKFANAETPADPMAGLGVWSRSGPPAIERLSSELTNYFESRSAAATGDAGPGETVAAQPVDAEEPLSIKKIRAEAQIAFDQPTADVLVASIKAFPVQRAQ
jgi:predicted thioredoxin/glutaredoxin